MSCSGRRESTSSASTTMDRSSIPIPTSPFDFHRSVVVPSGVRPPLESPNTTWARPLEDASGTTSASVETATRVSPHSGRILGLVFFYGVRKIERTPTWYSVPRDNAELGLAGESFAVTAWPSNGRGPIANRAPESPPSPRWPGGQQQRHAHRRAGRAAQVTAADPTGNDGLRLGDPARPRAADLKGAPRPDCRAWEHPSRHYPHARRDRARKAGQYGSSSTFSTAGPRGHRENLPFRVN